MKIYKLRCIKITGMTMREVTRTFLSEATAKRYNRLYQWIAKEELFTSAILPIEISDHGTILYVVSEDNHGAIGYFLDRDRAYEAARDVIMENPTTQRWDKPSHQWITTELFREDITDAQIDNYDHCVGVYDYPLNKTWCN